MNKETFSSKNPNYYNCMITKTKKEIQYKIMTHQKDFESGLKTFIRYCSFYDFLNSRYICKKDLLKVFLVLGLLPDTLNKKFPDQEARINRFNSFVDLFLHKKGKFINYHKLGIFLFNIPPFG